MTMTLEIPDELLEKLNAAARAQNTSPESVALRAIGEVIGENENGATGAHKTLDFESASEYVLNKNEELYRRLA